MSARSASALVSLAVLCAGSARAQDVGLEELLERARGYVQQFVIRFSNVVAEEQYKQEATSPRTQRVLRSDFLLVMFPGATEWHTFRDVVEVDGKPVRDRDIRLARLFVDPPQDVLRRARDITEAGTRYNLFGVGGVNNPLLAMAFVQAIYRDRFRFNLAGVDRDLGPHVRIVRFQEIQRPTIVRRNGNVDVFSNGLLWIEETTGRIVQTEYRVGNQRIPTRVVTRFAPDEDLQVNVPVEMRDWYPDGVGEIRGVATYGKFRRFQVKTEEKIK